MTFKFPHTPHLAWLGPGAPRNDKVLTPQQVGEFLDAPIVVEEKVDGANIGIYFDGDGTIQIKNRGTILEPGCHPQFQALWPWLAQHHGSLQEALKHNLVLFGEWCYAVHSVRYRYLPDFFIGFDIYDRHQRKFWSVARRNEWARPLDIFTAPAIGSGKYTLGDLESLLLPLHSNFGDQLAEGLYLRRDQGDWLQNRAKLVRSEFVQSIGQHWSARRIEQNLLKKSRGH